MPDTNPPAAAAPEAAANGQPAAPGDSGPVPLEAVERELALRVRALQPPGAAPLMRACMSTLIVACDRPELAREVEGLVPEVVGIHPARVLLLLGEPAAPGDTLTTTVRVRSHPGRAGRRLFSEQVTLHATGAAVHRLPYAVRELLIGDLPVNLWWAVPQPPPLAGVLLHDLLEHVQQLVFDSIGWPDPVRGVLAIAGWLAQFEPDGHPGVWRVASDLNWRRLKYWRRLLGQALDPASAPGALESITEVDLDHGPHAVVQAWELASWLAARLGWRVQSGQTHDGTELTWQCEAPHGPVRLRIRRLDQGPAAITGLRIACAVDGKPGALNFSVEGDRRLAVVPEDTGLERRTLTVPPEPLPGLVGRQLSDRERDPVFRQSMDVARALAQCVLE